MKYNYNYRNAQGQYAPYVLDTEQGKVINPTPAMYEAAGYLPYTPPTPTDEEIAEQERQASIESLKMQLSESDYKVIKVAECMALGLPAPYDVAALHQERQALRDQINALEAMTGEEYLSAYPSKPKADLTEDEEVVEVYYDADVD